jgi:hypothetical protein
MPSRGEDAHRRRPQLRERRLRSERDHHRETEQRRLNRHIGSTGVAKRRGPNGSNRENEHLGSRDVCFHDSIRSGSLACFAGQPVELADSAQSLLFRCSVVYPFSSYAPLTEARVAREFLAPTRGPFSRAAGVAQHGQRIYDRPVGVGRRLWRSRHEIRHHRACLAFASL